MTTLNTAETAFSLQDIQYVLCTCTCKQVNITSTKIILFPINFINMKCKYVCLYLLFHAKTTKAIATELGTYVESFSRDIFYKLKIVVSLFVLWFREQYFDYKYCKEYNLCFLFG